MDFPEAMAQYWKLRTKHEAGALSDEEFEAAVGDLTVVDAHGDPWQIGVSTGRWYRYDGQTWVEGFPELAGAGGAPPPPPPAQPAGSKPRARPPSREPAESPSISPPPGWQPAPSAARAGPASDVAPPSKSRLPIAGIIVAILVGCLCLVACVAAVFLLKPNLVPSGLPFAPSSSPVAPGPVVGNAVLRVENRAGTDICYMLISPSTSSDWGQDWLGETETIPPGGSRDFSVSPPQNYDLQALDCSGSVMAEQYGLYIGGSGTTWSVGP